MSSDSVYELQRDANVERNNEFLRSIGLLDDDTKKESLPASNKRKKEVVDHSQDQPPRRCSRLQNNVSFVERSWEYSSDEEDRSKHKKGKANTFTSQRASYSRHCRLKQQNEASFYVEGWSDDSNDSDDSEEDTGVEETFHNDMDKTETDDSIFKNFPQLVPIYYFSRC